MTNIKSMPLSREELSEFLDYDPQTGVFRWKAAMGRRVRVGAEAGQVKQTRPGGPEYRYIGIKGIQAPAARLAWLMVYGEWPATNVQFRDGDTLNVAEANLTLAKFGTVKGELSGRKTYKMSKEAQRHYGLKRYYGMTGEQYAAMITEQHGVCAICHQPETAMFNGVPKVMHVDHDHVSGAVRGLLCGNCNNGLGHFTDDPTALRAAADYIEHHSAKIVPLKAKDGA